MVGPNRRSRNVWLFNSLDFSGNPKWLFLYVLATRPDIEARWIADTEAKADHVRSLGYPATTYANQRVQAQAGVYVVNQVKERVPDALRGAVLLNLWHGVGVKQIERRMTESHLLPRIARKYIQNNSLYREWMMLLVTSPLMEEHFQAQIDPLPHQIIRADYPQNSVPRMLTDTATYDHDFRGAKGLGSDTRVVVWAPTYRLVGNAGFVMHALPDIERLVEALERTDQLLVLKMHPQLLSEPSYRELMAQYADHPRLLFWDNANDFYEVFDQIDTAIVDYSSILYDLLAGGVKKFIRYAFDIDEPGVLEAGLDYETMSVGTMVRDFEGLLSALESDNTVSAADRGRIEKAFWAYRSEGGPDAIVDAALAYEPQPVDLPTLYSFDIFDTVIHRRGVLPRTVFLGLRDRLLKDGAEWPAYFADQFEEIRIQAEAAVREAKRKDPRRSETKDFEITLEEIYDKIVEVYGITRAQGDRIQAWEIELELADVIPDSAMVDRVSELREAGETVVLVSDMYLPLSVIQEMLARADKRLSGIPVYLSREHGVQKSTSSLYARVFADIGYDFGEWVHVGDNVHADQKMAQALGITVDLIPVTRLDDTESEFLQQSPTHDAALVAGLYRQKRLDGSDRADFFAYRHLAGLLVPYVIWLVDDAVRRGYETLYFVARDGHFLKIIADQYIEDSGVEIKTRYIYGSRRSWRLASRIDGLSIDTFAAHGIFGGVRDVDAVARQAHLTVEALLVMVPELADFVDLKPWNAGQRGTVLATLRDSVAMREHLLGRAAIDNTLAQRYMRQEIDFTERFAFVDYWGRGLTQDCLVDIFRSMGDVDTTVPFYYARSIYPSAGSSIRHNYTSAAYRLTMVELILANQPYGTTLEYAELEDGSIGPVREPREYSRELLQATERMIAEFAHDIMRLPLDDREGTLRHVFRFSFEHFRQNPTHPDYAEFLAPLRDSVTMGDKEREFAPRLTLREYLSFLRTLRSDDLTRSMPISLSRSTRPVRYLSMLQSRIGFRRWVDKAKRAAGRLRQG